MVLKERGQGVGGRGSKGGGPGSSTCGARSDESAALAKVGCLEERVAVWLEFCLGGTSLL